MGLRAVLVCLACGTVWAQDRGVTIQWIGQSCFVIQSVDGAQTVVTDPPAASIGYRLPDLTADAVTITHDHPDHNNSAAVSGKFALVDGRTVKARQEMTAGGVPFVLVPGFHDNQNGAQRGPNTLIVWTQAGLKFAHLGDLGQDELNSDQQTALAGADVMFMPAGGFFTITPERAAAYIRQLRPRVAILMHYKTALGGSGQTAGLPAAAAPFAPLVYKPAKAAVSKSGLQDSTQVWVMQPASDTSATNGASFEEGVPVAPGSIVALFGKFSGSVSQGAFGYPLSRKIGDTEALVDGKAAPLYYVSPGQVNVQLPAASAPGQSLAEVRVAGQTVGRAPVTIVPMAPGLFVAVNQNGRPNSADTPASAGDQLVLYGTGIGAVTPAVEDGAAAQGSPASIGVTPNVFLQGRQLEVKFSGLTAGLAGVWQINVALPKDAPTGPDLPLVVVNGMTSRPLNVSVAPQRAD